ncbi:universal stress protein [Gulosibacter sp. 10]|uniref:universal stress protein n=1 Tax=Gulosibacter sp. 10 TaxID=1255570 RepID=UPI00097F083A|nr:universal stress protein [Gulosibacter sp. 10]SJM70961.1 Universal stress protein family [Gulosibacter sp. 10]
MTSRIVVGINGSHADGSAVAWAARLAAREGGSLLLFTAVDPLPRVGTVEGVESVEEWANDLLSGHAEAARKIAPDVELRTEVQRTSSLPATFEEVSSRASLLVIGSDAGDELRGRHPGSIRIAAVSKCPVVAVPDEDVSGRRGVVVGADGSDTSAKAIDFAAAEAAASGEPLIAVMSWQSDVAYGYGYGYAFAYVDDFQQAMEASCQEELDVALERVTSTYPDLEIQRVIAEGRPSAVLNEAAAAARMLVVGSHGRGAFRRLLLGSVSHELLGSIVVPTAVVR